MDLLVPVFLQLVGVAIVVAEVIIPSGGILAVLSTGVFVYSIYLVFNTVSVTAGFIFIGADAVLLPVLIIFSLKLLARSPVTLKTRLSGKDGVVSQSPNLEKFAGREGVALSDLRPSGVATISGERVDVVTRGGYIERDTAIVVLAVTGNQVIVDKKES